MEPDLPLAPAPDQLDARLPDALAREPEVALLHEAAVEAGEIARAHFERGVRHWHKDDASPVTEADVAVDRFLRERLTAARPDHGWLSEETVDAPDRLGRRHVFVVDPIDGTRGFLDGNDAWVVSVALVTDGRPRAGVLVRPMTGEIFTAAAGLGAFRGRERLSIPDRTGLSGARVAGPRRLRTHPPAIEAGLDVVPFIPSLALRLAMVSTGDLDVVLTFGGSSDWDLAAAELVVQEAGGAVETVVGPPLAYNRRTVAQPSLIAAGPGLVPAVRAIAEGLPLRRTVG